MRGGQSLGSETESARRASRSLGSDPNFERDERDSGLGQRGQSNPLETENFHSGTKKSPLPELQGLVARSRRIP